MEFTIKTLTPIWTGGVETGRMDRIHETGILGSLRWWYEVILRGLGSVVCDPSQHHCQLNSDAGLCPGCQIFGATGWKRRFHLRVAAQVNSAWEEGQSLNVKPYGRTRGWFLNPGQVGALTITLTGDKETLSQLAALFRFLEAWGNLGARPQLGYGLFQIVAIKDEPEPFTWKAQDNEKIGSLPDLRTFAFFKLQFTPQDDAWWREVSGLRELVRQRHRQAIIENLARQNQIPVTPALKNHLRFEQQWSSNALPHWFFGTLRGDQRVRSKISFSWAHRRERQTEWQIRGWTYLPQDSTGRRSRDEIAHVLQETLAQPQGWFKALGGGAAFRSAQVMVAPTTGFGRFHTPQQVADFLNGIPTNGQAK